MSQNKKLCDEFTDNFNYPDVQWDRVATPERIRSWIERTPARATALAQSKLRLWFVRAAKDGGLLAHPDAASDVTVGVDPHQKNRSNDIDLVRAAPP
jgi:hypothetical protein